MKAGELFVVTGGAYSDYGIYDHLRALRDFNWDECVAEWLSSHPEQTATYSGDFQGFLQWMRDKGCVESAPLLEIHIGDYGSFERSAEADARLVDGR